MLEWLNSGEAEIDPNPIIKAMESAKTIEDLNATLEDAKNLTGTNKDKARLRMGWQKPE